MDCFENASEIDSESRLKDKPVCMSFLILISVFKCLESGWGILMNAKYLELYLNDFLHSLALPKIYIYNINI